MVLNSLISRGGSWLFAQHDSCCMVFGPLMWWEFHLSKLLLNISCHFSVGDSRRLVLSSPCHASYIVVPLGPSSLCVVVGCQIPIPAPPMRVSHLEFLRFTFAFCSGFVVCLGVLITWHAACSSIAAKTFLCWVPFAVV